MDWWYLDRDVIVETKNLFTKLPEITLTHMTTYNTPSKLIGEVPQLNLIEQLPPKAFQYKLR